MGVNIWVSSDFHLGHKNLVLGTTEWEQESRRNECRKFSTLKEHDDAILKNINDNIEKDDILYFLGDFSFGGSDNIAKYRSLIKCENIHFTFGNHDHLISKNKIVKYGSGFINAQNLFSSCQQMIEKKIGKEKFWMGHYPIVTRHKPTTSPIILFGHFHGTLTSGYSNNSPSLDVGIDTHPEFRPYHINEIKEIIKNRKDYEYFTNISH